MRLGRYAGDRAAGLGVDALEAAAQLDLGARGEALVRVKERGGKRERLADARLRDRHLAHYVEGIAAAHDDLVDAGVAQVQPQRQLGRARRWRAVAREQIDLQRRGAQRLDGEPAAEQGGEVRAQSGLADRKSVV